MKKLLFAAVLCAFICCIIVILSQSRDPQTAEAVEQALQEANQLPESWQSKYAQSDEIIGVLVYPEKLDTCKYELYIKKKDDRSYTFRRGSGYDSDAFGGIVCYTLPELKHEVYISMNQQNICAVSINDGESVTNQEIDPNQPFVFIFPKSYGIVFTTAKGERIEPTHLAL